MKTAVTVPRLCRTGVTRIAREALKDMLVGSLRREARRRTGVHIQHPRNIQLLVLLFPSLSFTVLMV